MGLNTADWTPRELRHSFVSLLSDAGVLVEKIALGRIHAGQVVTVHVAAETITIDLGGDTRTVRRTTSQAVRSIKAHRPREPRAAHVS